MKKTLIITAVVAGYACAAQAQSSVTLYGVIDAGLSYTNNQKGHSVMQAGSG
ncbi:MAG: ral bacterial porin, family, partial [Paraburkholderia sp.]|nr:ral bacterial porin, family [Paraburkholderia sp.]